MLFSNLQMNKLLGLKNISSNDQLAQLYLERERRWKCFLDMHFPDARLLRWGAEHRVYHIGQYVVKIEWGPASSNDPKLKLEYEYSLLKSLEHRAQMISPSFSVVDGNWHVLRMDWIAGEDLDTLRIRGCLGTFSIVKLLAGIYQISLAGVAYKQLRARHIIRRSSGDLAFIDFGGSTNVNPIVAIWRNFSPVAFSGGSWQTGRLAGILIAIIRGRGNKRSAQSVVGRASSVSPSVAKARWEHNEQRAILARPEKLAAELGSEDAVQHLLRMEGHLSKAAAPDSEVCRDYITVQIGSYSLAGTRDWGFIWDYLERHINFSRKSVVDLMCGMGGMAAYARLSGARRVIS